MGSEIVYTARFTLPRFLQRNLDRVVSMPVYRDGALVAPASGTYTLYNQNHVALIDAQNITVTGSIATYPVTAAVVDANQVLDSKWQEEWVVVLAGDTYTFRRPVHLVLRELYPVITTLDLYNYHRDLNPLAAGTIVASGTDHQDQIDEAFDFLQARLLRKGKRPYLILDPESLRESHINKTLSVIFRDLMLDQTDGKYGELADFYEGQLKASWGELVFIYDTDQDGDPTDEEESTSAVPVVYLSRPSQRWSFNG